MSTTFVTHALSDPPRVELRSPQGRRLATLTRGARTVTSAGPRRSFVESDVRVTHATWVRALPAPFDGRIDAAWLQQALAANAQGLPDLVAIGLQYLRGAPAQHEGGLQVAGDAAYGPLVDGKRQEGADFNDYLGVPWTYRDGTLDAPEPLQRHCLDCSGFVRMVWGYRRHAPGTGPALPLSRASSADGSSLPRRAFQMCRLAPGVLVAPDRGVRLRDLSRLAIGDLVFFDADADDGRRIDHVGVYIGIGSDGLRRFISSRKGANGPTMADVRGKSVLDGSGLYARSLRAVRRL